MDTSSLKYRFRFGDDVLTHDTLDQFRAEHPRGAEFMLGLLLALHNASGQTSLTYRAARRRPSQRDHDVGRASRRATVELVGPRDRCLPGRGNEQHDFFEAVGEARELARLTARRTSVPCRVYETSGEGAWAAGYVSKGRCVRLVVGLGTGGLPPEYVRTLAIEHPDCANEGPSSGPL